MRMKRSMALPLAALVFASCAAPRSTTSFRTSDGFTIFADVHVPARGSRAPLVVLSHQLERDRHSWDPLVPRLLAAGYAVVTVDQRGFGESVKEAASPARLSMEAKQRMELDLLGAIRLAGRNRDIDTTRVAVIGTGVSATAAVRCAREDPWVRALALFVGVLDADAEDFLIDRSDLPLLMVAAVGDIRGTGLMRQYGERFTGPAQQYVELPASGEGDAADWRGTDGLRGDTGLAELILWFLERNLPAAGTTSPSGTGRSGTHGIRGSR
jgi:dienelactone hydrolase